MEIARERVIEIVASVVAIGLMIVVLVLIGSQYYSEAEGVTGSGGILLLVGVVLFVLLMGVIGYVLAFTVTGQEDDTAGEEDAASAD